MIFYILAGYVVSHLYKDIFSVTKAPSNSFGGAFGVLQRVFPFYKDRFLRIFPLYLYVITITIIFLLLTSFSNPNFTLLKLINNVTIIPLNYYMYIDNTVLTNPSWWLIPPAWSLGTELQAYIVLPFALMFKRFKIVLAFLSFVVYIVANFSIIHPDYFGYRLIVGVFFIFLLGSAIQSYEKTDKYFITAVWISILIFIPIFAYTNSFSPTYTKETFIGLLVGIPLVLLISKTKRKFH